MMQLIPFSKKEFFSFSTTACESNHKKMALCIYLSSIRLNPRREHQTGSGEPSAGG